MSLPVIVDVIIGLVFIYLILSLLASEIQELISTILQWRAKHLKESIINLLSGDTTSQNSIERSKQLTQQLYSHPLLQSVNQEARGLFALMFRRITWFFSCLYQGIVGKENNFGSQKTAPSYISPETFSTALMEQLGVAKLVEMLVEAKFSRFQKLIISEVESKINLDTQLENPPLNEQPSSSDSQKRVQLELEIADINKHFQEISDRFDRREITLETAIDKTSDRLDRFIQKLESGDHKNALSQWKKGFFGEKNELAIVNGAIKPTLLEIADSMDAGSRTYKNYRDKFKSYQHRRYKEATDQLNEFLKRLDRVYQKISSNSSVLTNISEVIFDSESSASISETRRFKIPLYQVHEEILNVLKNSNNSQNQKIRVFIAGFSGQGRTIESKSTFWLSVILLMLIVLTVFIVILNPELIIGSIGGIAFSCWLLLLLGIFLSVEKYLKQRRKSQLRKKGNGRTLAELFEQVLVMEDFTIENSSENSFDNFCEKIRDNEEFRNKHNDENSTHSLEEFRDLGRSFRRYLQKIVLNNADVDAPFIPSSVKQNLSLLVKKSKLKADEIEERVDYFSEETSKWFDNSMERATGVYKRNAKGISILIGLVLAIITNANSIYILDRLAYDRELRQALVSASERQISSTNIAESETSDFIKKQIEESEKALRDVDLPIGWNPALLARQIDCELKPKPKTSPWSNLFDTCINLNPTKQKSKTYFIPTSLFVMFLTTGKIHVALLLILGWLLTGIAISMGATFWFELLGKVINVRNTGRKPIASNRATKMSNDSQQGNKLSGI